ncbi:PepSY domain-containing protein [Altererythrobacter sp. FM1]|uniref:PepSY-associated TM helix domain-containing protein n=1 Tax=Tsuneonella flava TaxID=2055955 RepID=UPI000C802188|nr:PepSY-associated TM helix domain-containing protein [Tsuneonella flava]ROT96676.1 PepSY domain-containing protein [Altererythrobacter sp. FM1]
MNLLATLHRWAGATIGAILIVLGLSGIALVWEDEWIGVPGAGDLVDASPPALAHAVDAAMTHHDGLSRVTFASDGTGLHQTAYADGSGAYLNGQGAIVEQWSGKWQRPELWIFDLHHYLFAGDIGKTITGIAGLAGVFFVISGAILWWRTRRTFVFRLWPKRMTRSAIIRQHRDLGIIVAPFLFVVLLSGSAMVFKPLGAALVTPFPAPIEHPALPATQVDPNDWEAIFRLAKTTFPGAEIRRLQFGAETTTLRLRQPFEWTPNGRSYLRIDNAGLVTVDAPTGAIDRQNATEKFYPIHAGKVGGIWWKIVLTLTGMSLVLLGALAFFGFWFRRK